MAVTINSLSGTGNGSVSSSEYVQLANSGKSVLEKAQWVAERGGSISEFSKATNTSEADIKAALLQAGVQQGEAAAAPSPAPASTPTPAPASAAPSPASNFPKWNGGKPASMGAAKEHLNGARGLNLTDGEISNLLYGGVGTNDDFRNFSAIMNAADPLAANDQALGDMFDDPNYRHPKGYDKKAPPKGENVIGKGNLRVSLEEGKDGLVTPTVWAVSANGANAVRIGAFGNSDSPLKDGQLARYGITKDDINAALQDPKLAGYSAVQNYLGSQVGKAYDPNAGAQYTVTKAKEAFTDNGGAPWTGKVSVTMPLEQYAVPFNRTATAEEASAMDAGKVWGREWNLSAEDGPVPVGVQLVSTAQLGYDRTGTHYTEQLDLEAPAPQDPTPQDTGA